MQCALYHLPVLSEILTGHQKYVKQEKSYVSFSTQVDESIFFVIQSLLDSDLHGGDSDSEGSDVHISGSGRGLSMNEAHTHAMLQHTLSNGGLIGLGPGSANPTSEELMSWGPVNNSIENFLPTRTLHGNSAVFDLEDQTTLVEIFVRLLPSDLLIRIFESYPAEHWVYTSGTAHGKVLQGRPNLRLIYQYFAIYIRSIALLESQNNGATEEQKDAAITRPIEFPRKRGRPPSSVTLINAQAAIAAANASGGIVPAVGTQLDESDSAANLLALNRSATNPVVTSGPVPATAPATSRDEQKRPLRNCIKECIDYFIVRLNNATINAANASISTVGTNGLISSSLAAQVLATGARVDRQVPGYDMMEKFWSRFHIREQFYEEIFANFQSLLESPGDYLVTNEHLLYFQGHSNQIQFTLNRSNDKHGLYFFSCHCVLRDPFTLANAANSNGTGASGGSSSSSALLGSSSGTGSSSNTPTVGRGAGNSFLLHGKLFYSNPKQGRVPNMDEYLALWQGIYRHFQSKDTSSSADMNTRQIKLLLHHNSLSEDSLDREVHRDADTESPNFTPFLCLANATKFPKVLHILTHRCGKLRQRGDLVLIHNEKKNSICVSYWNGYSLIGKRNYVTNLFHKQTSSINMQTGEEYHPVKIEEINQRIASVFRSYGNTFAEEMHDRRLCHKTGGKSKLGQDGQEHKLILACILHNTFAAYGFMNSNNTSGSKPVQEMSFSELCIQLSNELFDFALTLGN